MLQLTKQRATVANLNLRAELHGEASVNAADLSLKMEVAASVLDDIDLGLMSVLYKNPAGKQIALVGADAIKDGPELRWPGLLELLTLSKEFSGYTARVVWGDLAGSTDITLLDAIVTSIRAKAKPGGTVLLTLQVQCHPTPTTIGELSTLITKEVDVWLAPPTSEMPKADL